MKTIRPGAGSLKVVAGVFLISTALGLFFTAQIYYSALHSHHNVSWAQALYWAFGDWYEWALLSPLLLWLSRRFPFNSTSWFKSAVVHLVAGALISVLHAALCSAAALLQGWVVGPPGDFMLGVRNLLISRFHFNFAAYGLIVCAWHAWILHGQSQARAVEARELAGRLAEVQLEMLRLQLNPHFLCNTLNAISSLMLTDINAANKMIARLGELLRVALQSREPEVPLKREMEILRQYLDIERIRFGDRLHLNFEVAPETLDAAVPSLILQPLVENAIHHGVADIPNAQITVRAIRENGSLRMEIQDNGRGFTTRDSKNSASLGLENTRGRLRLLYGDAQQFELTEQRGGGVFAKILIPFHLAQA
jgi:two-component sensor histidine kinase